MTEDTLGSLHAGPYHGNLLNPAVRREITDLNRLFLERALQAHAAEDAWYRLSSAAFGRLAGAPPDARERVAHCPIALFELRLPDTTTTEAGCNDTGERDSDLVPGAGSQTEARRAFGMAVLGVARRLREGVPLAPRIAFGLDARVEAQLAAISLSETYRVAAWPGLIRPRWPQHDRFWSLLVEAVSCGDGIQWAYTAGLCLLAQCEREPAVVAYSARPRARPGHRRPVPPGRDVPC